jgi:hypothetical protein
LHPLEDKEWDEKYIYGALFHALKGKIHEPFAEGSHVENHPFTGLQRSGTCTFASYFAYLENKLSAEEFGRLHIAIGLHVLHSFIRADNLAWDGGISIALGEKCMRYFSQQVLSAESKRCITFPEFKAIQRILESLSCTVQEFKKIDERRSNNAVLGRFLRPSSFLFSEIKVTYQIPGTHTVAFQESALLPPVNISDISTLHNGLEGVLLWAKEQRQRGRDLEVHLEIGRFTKDLRHAVEANADALATLKKETRIAIIKHIRDIAETYLDSFVSTVNRKGALMQGNPRMCGALIDCIVCVKCIGNDLEAIRRYPLNFGGIFVRP